MSFTDFITTYETPIIWIGAALLFLAVLLAFARIGQAIIHWYNKNKLY